MITPPIDLLSQAIRYETNEWRFSQLEGLGAAHPLVKSGLLAFARRRGYYDCPHTCCDDPEREVIEEDDGTFIAMCPCSGEPLHPTNDELSVWKYDPERMAQILQDLLSCAALQQFDEETWCLGRSAHPALDGRLIFVQTSAHEDSLCRALKATPNAPYILLTGRADTLSDASPIRPHTFTFAATLTFTPRGTLTLLPHAFATLPPLQGQTKSLASVTEALDNHTRKVDNNTRKVDKLESTVRTLVRHYNGDHNTPNLRSRANNKLVIRAVEKYWELVRQNTPPRQATTDACRATEQEFGLAGYRSFESFRNAVKREIDKHAHALSESSATLP